MQTRGEHRVILFELLAVESVERRLVTIPAGETVYSTGKTVRSEADNAMAEVVWRDQSYAVFTIDLQRRTESQEGSKAAASAA